jgi:hypothetical protein
MVQCLLRCFTASIVILEANKILLEGLELPDLIRRHRGDDRGINGGSPDFARSFLGLAQTIAGLD